MKAAFLMVLGVLMVAGAFAMSVWGPTLTEGQSTVLVLFGIAGALAFIGGVENL
jgi:hypothetical protein